jgi:2-keto-4-pentenoate hydratase/2-oxohepta-3-ene-1,7-dioic acid hydratase in catechol pathway
MEFVTFDWNGETRWGYSDGQRIAMAPATPAAPATLRGFIEGGGELGDTSDWPRISPDCVTRRAPIPEPRRNIMCLGLNYADHAGEAQGTSAAEAQLPSAPVVFTKATTTVTGPDAVIPVDPRATSRLDWEVELAVVIGRGGRFIDAERAHEHVFGYTVINDLSARDRQKQHQQFFLGKSMDGSCPMGPGIVTADAIADPHALAIRSWVNGTLKQNANTARMIFRIDAIIAELSSVMTLLAGDIIATGTPSGVGFARQPRELLEPGDRVTCAVADIGQLSNPIAGPSAD